MGWWVQDWFWEAHCSHRDTYMKVSRANLACNVTVENFQIKKFEAQLELEPGEINNKTESRSIGEPQVYEES